MYRTSVKLAAGDGDMVCTGLEGLSEGRSCLGDSAQHGEAPWHACWGRDAMAAWPPCRVVPSGSVEEIREILDCGADPKFRDWRL